MFVWLWIVSLTACQVSPYKPFNYRPYLDHMPASILILPPVNQSMEVMAPYKYLSTITRPIAEKGYYVFPVAVIDALMKENGVTTPEDMHQIPLAKIKQIINPDAILYVTIKEWGTKYKVLDSQTIIIVYAKLIHTESETVIWQNERQVVKSSTNNSNSLAEMLIAALINQVMSNFLDPSIEVARGLNNLLYYNSTDGLLSGKYHPLFDENQKKCIESMNSAGY